KVALAAVAGASPARLEWGIGNVGFSANRRTKGGPVDHDLPIMMVRSPDGKLRAIWFSYACHCVTLSHNKVSGDWAGFAQEAIEQDHSGCMAVASVGCGADSNPISGVKGDKIELAQDQGRQVADEVNHLLGGKLSPVTKRPNIRYARLDLPFDTPRSRMEWEERAQRSDAIGHHARVALAKLDRGQTLPTKINYPIQTWVFGDQLAIVFLPGETVVDYSRRIKRDYERVWVNGYSNDARCYIPSERVLAEGAYEGGDAMIYYDFPQRFAPGLEQKIIDVVSKQVPASFKKSQ
ncbi:MAG TPA: dehydrogenase, partial [Candidatus Binatia bacterium]|nr:dehydrogenase [Candidatus Binatia bacterium]